MEVLEDEPDGAFPLAGEFAVRQVGHVPAVEDDGALGRRVDVVTNSWYPAGDHEINYATGHLEDGLYVYRLTTGNIARTAKLVVAK